MARLHIRIMTGSGGPEYLLRAEEHLRLWRDGDQLQDHMPQAATRLGYKTQLTRRAETTVCVYP